MGQIVYVHIPREIAFTLRNRLKFAKIPYIDVRVEVIGVDAESYQTVLRIVDEIRQRCVGTASG
ncbi:hypothetical protein DRP05_13915 [Archaeoglobales archaeon]|nr:MAG: hypothetical protein DRP05_13915 [Archaeoglobales archaeon]